MALLPPIEKEEPERLVIDLSKPEGNAFYLLGIADKLATQLGYDEDKKKELQESMKSHNYEHLIAVFDIHFGAYVDLILTPGLMPTTQSSSPKVKVK